MTLYTILPGFLLGAGVPYGLLRWWLQSHIGYIWSIVTRAQYNWDYYWTDMEFWR